MWAALEALGVRYVDAPRNSIKARQALKACEVIHIIVNVEVL